MTFGRRPQESYLDPNPLIPSDTPHEVLKLFAFAQAIFSKLCRAADFLLWSLEVNFLQLFGFSQYLLCSDLSYTEGSADHGNADEGSGRHFGHCTSSSSTENPESLFAYLLVGRLFIPDSGCTRQPDLRVALRSASDVSHYLATIAGYAIATLAATDLSFTRVTNPQSSLLKRLQRHPSVTFHRCAGALGVLIAHTSVQKHCLPSCRGQP